MTTTLNTVDIPAVTDPSTTPDPVTPTPTPAEPPPAPAPAPAAVEDAAPAADPAEVARQAEDAYRASLAAGNPLNGREIGEQFGRSERWGRARLAAVHASGKGAAKPRTSPSRRKATSTKATVTKAAPAAAPATTGAAAAQEAPEAERQPVPAPASSVAASVAAAETAAASQPRTRTWLVWLLALPAFVAIWGGWVGLGELTGFGRVNLLPGIGDGLFINTAITLPIGVEAYAAFAFGVWLSASIHSRRAKRFAMYSAIGSLLLGMAGQVAYHLMKAAGITVAPWPITAFVACLPVVVLGCGAALAHLIAHDRQDTKENQP
ncbi:hypothetical protein M8C13_36245 [Crossiella sp. SN42]|uniref:hypothetical protein n=1 Tax=Crossiella sp. SN42 TaxID=2944808 RepID=UPI00207D13BC|nr:hypothetical protein [Crossiella sp. SN42]MCO1581215.1 hypothetical protein [Crossiella sp. SN42]